MRKKTEKTEKTHSEMKIKTERKEKIPIYRDFLSVFFLVDFMEA